MITTNHEGIYKKLLIIRNQGQEGYNHTWLGNNFRVNDILAAFGIEQLKIETILDKKVELVNAYFKHLSEFTEIKTR